MGDLGSIQLLQNFYSKIIILWLFQKIILPCFKLFLDYLKNSMITFYYWLSVSLFIYLFIIWWLFEIFVYTHDTAPPSRFLLQIGGQVEFSPK